MGDLIANCSIKIRITATQLPVFLEHASSWHGQIIQAIRSRNSEFTKAAMRMHMNQVKADLHIALQTI